MSCCERCTFWIEAARVLFLSVAIIALTYCIVLVLISNEPTTSEILQDLEQRISELEDRSQE